jgi:hypothetical protein
MTGVSGKHTESIPKQKIPFSKTLASTDESTKPQSSEQQQQQQQHGHAFNGQQA